VSSFVSKHGARVEYDKTHLNERDTVSDGSIANGTELRVVELLIQCRCELGELLILVEQVFVCQ